MSVVPANNESSSSVYDEEELVSVADDLADDVDADDVNDQKTILVSREGKRKQRVSSNKSTPVKMIQHQVHRRKKTAAQVDYLKSLFHKLDGKWNGKVRREAM